MLSRRVIAAITLVLLPELGLAGAWTRPEGSGQLIFTSGRRVAPVGALAGGVADDDSNITQVFVEYGLLEDLTLGGTLFADISTSDPGSESAGAGVFLRKRVWQGDHGVFSVQAGYIHPAEDIVPGQFGVNSDDSTPEVEARLLYGHSLWGDWGSAFFSSEFGYDWRGGGVADEIRTDLTAGYEPFHCCLAIMSLFTTVPVQGGSEASVKIAPSFAYTMLPTIDRNEKKPTGPFRPSTIQIGLNYDLLNPDDGIGVQLSIWRRF